MDNDGIVLTAEELDTIGEVINISMGSAATAISTMLDKQVLITTPHVEHNRFENLDYSNLEPAIIVKINYIEGITGSNVIMLRRNDMRIILDLLMGNEYDPNAPDNFEFDDMSMSAACEVMNQMMGASATALSEILQMPVNISTPESCLVETREDVLKAFTDGKETDDIVSISFKLNITDIVDTVFSSFMSIDLAKKIVSKLTIETINTSDEGKIESIDNKINNNDSTSENSTPQINNIPGISPQFAVDEIKQNAINQVTQQVPQNIPQNIPQPQVAPTPVQANFMPQQGNGYQAQPQTPNQAQFTAQQPVYSASATQQQPYISQQPYMDPQIMQNMAMNQQNTVYGMNGQQGHYNQNDQSVVIKKAEFPDFGPKQVQSQQPYMTNLNLLMGVQLEISVVIGRAKRKIKDIMDFGQGSVIELDKQTGAPAELIVNGQLLAYGDVIVVGDNFGIRVTEIVGTKDLIDSLGSTN